MLRVLQSPSAAERIAAAAEFIRSFAAATELLLVGSSREAVDDLVRGLAHTSGATFGLHRFSFTQLAARLAIGRLAAAGVTPSSVVGAEALAARAAYEASVRNELPYFAPVTKFPGFALQAALEEVRTGADLARHPLLLLDVPVHSAIERAFLVELASAAKELLCTCPAGDLRSLDNLKMVPGAQENAATPVPKDSSLARLGFYLFSETTPPEGRLDDEVVFYSAPGEERESVEIVRRILAEAEKGIPFDRMAVLLRAPETYGGLMEAAMRRAGIPAYFARGSRRPDPSGRALLALLACAAEGLSAHRFAEYLSFAQVPSLAQDGAPPESKTEFVPPEDDALNSAFARPMPNTSQDEDGDQYSTERREGGTSGGRGQLSRLHPPKAIYFQHLVLGARGIPTGR